MNLSKVKDYSLITKLFYTFRPRPLAWARPQYICISDNLVGKISNLTCLRVWNINTVFINDNVFSKMQILAIRSVQTPALAMLSGQRSALESIQAVVFVCASLCRRRSSQSAPTYCQGLHETLAGAQPISLLKSEWRALPHGTGWTAADILALWRDRKWEYE